MLIQCTKKLLDKLNIKPEVYSEEEDLFCWHANLITVNRRKAVVLVNNKNRYVIVLYGLKANHFKNLSKHIIEAIVQTFKEECINDEVIEKFIKLSGEIIYTKTKNPSMVAKMNKACDTIHFCSSLLDNNSIYNTALSIGASRDLVGKDYMHPNEDMYKDIEAFAGKNIFRCKAIEFKIILNLEKYDVWRKVIVPENITFKKFHKVIQAVFGWEDYHLHDFYVYEKVNNNSVHKREEYKPIVNLVCDEEAFDYQRDDIEMKLENNVKLSEYIKANIKYNYDFGDDWQHYIVVEKIIDDYDKNYSICVEGKGNTPPEDVGGQYGYEEFLQIISNEKHPDHDEMVVWGESQGYEKFDIDVINRRLKFIVR